MKHLDDLLQRDPVRHVNVDRDDKFLAERHLHVGPGNLVLQYDQAVRGVTPIERLAPFGMAQQIRLRRRAWRHAAKFPRLRLEAGGRRRRNGRGRQQQCRERRHGQNQPTGLASSIGARKSHRTSSSSISSCAVVTAATPNWFETGPCHFSNHWIVANRCRTLSELGVLTTSSQEPSPCRIAEKEPVLCPPSAPGVFQKFAPAAARIPTVPSTRTGVVV